MIRRNDILETEIIEKTILRPSLFAHHGKTPSLKAIEQQNHTTTTSSKDFFNTLSHVWTAPSWQGIFDGDAKLVGAAMCPACLCGAVGWPLAIMLSADQVPVKSTQS